MITSGLDTGMAYGLPATFRDSSAFWTRSDMKVCLVSKADSFGGGASRVAEELADLLLRNGYGAQHWVSWTGKGYSDIRRPLYGTLERYLRAAHTASKRFMALPESIPFELLPIFFRKSRWKQ